MEKRIRQTAGEESEEVSRQQNVNSWLFRINCMHVLCPHQLSATMWVPLPPDRIASPRLLIVRRPKSGMPKTVPAVPAAPALVRVRVWGCEVCV